jgi:hypothetical protein
MDPWDAYLEPSSEVESDSEVIDPDPFSIGLGIFAAIAGGGAFLESRRQREILQDQQRGAFRGAWFAARRSLIHFKQQIDEFETYMLEDGYGQQEFRIGAVRLVVDRGRHHSMRRLRGQTLVTANRLGDDMDDLSEYLGAEYSDRVQEVLGHLQEIQLPATYRDLIRTARSAFDAYESFLTYVADIEGFEVQAD